MIAETTLTQSFGLGITPDPQQTVAEWSDEHMVLPNTDAEPGKYRTSRTPYLKEIMEAMSPSSPVPEIVIQKSAQMGLTRAATNWVGFLIHRAPAPILFIEPTVDVARKVSKQRVQPMLDEVPCLQGLVRESRARDSGNTILAKDFTGGMLVMTGANSGIGLRFMAAKILILDEVDAYPYDVDGEGSPCSLAEKRTLTFPRRKILKFSTPLLKQTSVIEPAYEQSDHRRYYVPCPFCGHGQPLYWAQLTWPQGKEELAKYLCSQCGELIPEHHKTRMLEQGEWIAESPGPWKAAGFHVNGLYAPYGWVNSWAKLAKDWTTIIHKRDLREQQTFTNTVLAETWEDVGERFNTDTLKGRREMYPAPVPHDVLTITAGIDVQDDRLEALAVGWGLKEESWLLDYQRWMGSPGQAAVWQQADDWLLKSWTHESGVLLRIQRACIDTGGHHTQETYQFIRPRQPRGVYATKGSNQSGAPLVLMGSRSNGVRLFFIGTDAAKDTLFARLKLEESGPGSIHFPMADPFDDEFFEQVAAEQKVNKYKRGVLVDTLYEKIRSRNEALDLLVLNMAALAILNPNLEALAAHRAREIAARSVSTETKEPQDPLPKSRWFDPMQRGRGFIKRW